MGAPDYWIGGISIGRCAHAATNGVVIITLGGNVMAMATNVLLPAHAQNFGLSSSTQESYIAYIVSVVLRTFNRS
jgi:hypothetical protein